MPTHTATSGSLPITFDRRFQLKRYGVSHSELELRSVSPDSASDFIEVIFYAVLGMKLKTLYPSLTIGLADSAQKKELVALADQPESRLSDFHFLALKSGDGVDGLVVCGSYTVWLCPRGWVRNGSSVRTPEHRFILKSQNS